MKSNSSRVYLLCLAVVLLAGCQSAPPRSGGEGPVRQVEPDAESSQPEAREQEQAAARAQWKLEAERRAEATRRQAAEQAQKQAEEQRRKLAAEKRAEEVRKQAAAEQERAQRKEQQERAAALLGEVESALESGKLAAAEERLDHYHQLLGNRALKQQQYQSLRQRAAAMKQVFADMEQASAAEAYLQQQVDEAQALERDGDPVAAKRKYGEILQLNPEHQGARRGIEQLLTADSASPAVEAETQPVVKQGWQQQSTLLGEEDEGWVVQVATYPEDGKREAYALLGTIKKAGFKAVFIKKQELAGRQLYRVRIGAYGERDEATAVSERVSELMAQQDVRVASRVMQQRR